MTRPAHGVKRRWRDLAAADVKAVGGGQNWYGTAQDSSTWRAICEEGIAPLVEGQSDDQLAWPTSAPSQEVCVCGRSFRRKGDLTRHRRFCGSQADAL